MKKYTLLLASSLFVANVFAQQQLPNAGFETWENEGTATQEPTNWSSLKTADALASLAPEVLSRDNGNTGNYSAVLEVKSAFGIAANGLITNGRVHADLNPENGYVFTDVNDAQWNTPFTSRPDSLVGWVKYAPVNNDKGKVEVILHTGNSARLPMDATTQANMVGHLRYDFTTAASGWVRFSAPFTYSGSQNPEFILVTIAAGDSTVSQAGTKMWIDDLQLIYNPPPSGIGQLQLQSFYHIYAADGNIYIDTKSTEDTYIVNDASGRIIQSGKVKSQVPFQHASGIYFIQIRTDKGNFFKKIYIP